jgi:RNA polymerase sigma factor (sigma-70 family)
MGDVSRILTQVEAGDWQAAEQLLPLVYDELRRVASAKLAQELPGQTLQATALVHEAYLRLVGDEERSEIRGQRSDEESPTSDLRHPTSGRWQGRRHFFAAAAEAMRRILIERARQRESLKRGGDHQRIELDHLEPAVSPLATVDLLCLDEALQKLERQKPRQAELVKLRFFAGLSMPEAAEALNISLSTAENDWAFARSWLRLEMQGRGGAANS